MTAIPTITDTGRVLLGGAKAHAGDVFDAARARQASQLCEELRRVASRATRATTIAVVGHRSRGKSTLINAMLDAPGLLPTEVDVTTNAHIAIGPPEAGREEAAYARVHYVDGEAEELDLSAFAPGVERARGARTPLEPFASEADNPHNEKGVQRIEVFVRHPLLDEGFRFLDTPGVGGLIGPHGRKTLEAVGAADGLLMLLEANQPMTEQEIAFIAKVAARSDRVVFAHNRADKAKDPERIMRDNRAALEQHAPQLARSPMVAVAARQAERALAARSEDPEYADELVAESNLAALLDALRAQVMDAVLASQAQAMLAQTGAALEELERADREVLEIAAGAHDVDERIAATQRELKALRNRPPQPRLRERLGEAQREVTRDFRDGLDELGDRMLDRVDRDWGRELAAAIPEEIQNEVDALWGAAANALDRRASETAGALFAEYGLGTIDVAAHAGQVRALADLDGSIPPPPKPRSTMHRTLMRISRIGGAVGLWLWGMPLLIPAAAVGLVLYEERRERHIGEQGEAKKFVGRRIRAARKAFDRAFDQRIAGLRTSLLGELEPRYQARLESVETAGRSLTELKRKAASADAVRARLAELEPLWQRQTDLQTRLTGKEQS